MVLAESECMSIVERVRDVLAEKIADLNKDEGFRKLRDFNEEMWRKGVAQKQPYSLPPLDTVGRRLRRIATNKLRVPYSQ